MKQRLVLRLAGPAAEVLQSGVPLRFAAELVGKVVAWERVEDGADVTFELEATVTAQELLRVIRGAEDVATRGWGVR